LAGSAQTALRLSPVAVKNVTEYLMHVLSYHRASGGEFRNKLEQIDLAYARFKVANVANDAGGVDVQQAADTQTGVTEKDVTVPVVISQVDSFVGYLADVYLSGYPMFPIVSDPDDAVEAEMLETILDWHSLYGRYPANFLRGFRNAIKYNFMPMEYSWEPLDQYQIVGDYLKPSQESQLKQTTQYITAVRSLDPYNLVWDRRYDPVDVAFNGEFAGYIDIQGRIPLKRFINSYSASGELYNVGEINNMGTPSGTTPATGNLYFTRLPTITDMLSQQKTDGRSNFDWAGWMGQASANTGIRKQLPAGAYERFTCYARIIPAELGINAPKPNSPQIWKFILINGTKLLYAKRIYTIYDTLPISIGQPLDDGFGLQTQSIGEAQIPMQEAASTLFNIRFNSARRAVSDRALFDPAMINESDVNSRNAAPKIPVRMSGLNDKKLTDSYEQIPYDPHGTDSVIQDARSVLDLADKLSGLNQPQQGRFQKGNKSVQEWQDTMNNADNRPRLPALAIEFQMMVPLKEQLKLNIYQNGAQGNFQNFRTGTTYKIDSQAIEKMKAKVLSFRVADGYTPKSKLASTDFLAKGLETIAQVPQLAQTLGASLPKMFTHMMALGGVRGLDQYLPKATAPQAGTGAPGAQPVVEPVPGAVGGTTKP
jgi:hypothetical protein